MKKNESKKPLPKLNARTLDVADLSKVTGGMMPSHTGSTRSICHIDGVDDGD